jgi:plastocyanin
MGILPRPAILLACLAPLLTGCGDDDSPPGADRPHTVVMTDYEFHPRELQVTRDTTVTVLNEGGIAHNLTIERGSERVAGTSSFLKGDRERLRIDLPPGRYRMVCTVPGHRGLGMTGTLVVR